MNINKHYIRLDEKINVIKGFSDVFEKPVVSDILLNDKGGRHFELNGVINPTLSTIQGIYLYRYTNGKIVAKTQIEIDTEVVALPPALPSEVEVLKTEVGGLNQTISDLLETIAALA